MRYRSLLLPLVSALFFGALLWLVRQTGPIPFGDTADIRSRALGGPSYPYLLFAVSLCLVVLIVRVTDAIVFDTLLIRRRVVAPQLLRQVVSVALYGVLISIVISILFSESATGLLASGTIVAAVLALALQDTLGNLFSGIALHLENAFEVGDVLQSGELIGIVEGVNWRAARLRTLDNNVIVLPNSVIARERLEVYRRGNPAGRRFNIRLSYDAEPAEVIAIISRAIENVPGVSHAFRAHARIFELGEYAVVYEIRYWIEDYHQRDGIDAEVRRVIWYALRRNGLRVPYPVRTVQIERTRGGRDVRSDTGDALRRIGEVHLLDPLSEEQKRELAAALRQSSFSRGETIIRHGETGSSMFIVHRGEVSVRRVDEREIEEVARLGEGDVFGEISLLTGEKRTADVVACTDVVVLEVAKEALQPLLESSPELARELSQRMIVRRAGLDHASAHAADDGVTTMMSRVRSWFGLK